MKLDVSQAIRNPGCSYPFTAAQAIAPQEVLGDIVTFDDADMQGTLMATEDGTILVKGSLRTTAHTLCANCLAPASAPIAADFDESFLLNGDPEDDEHFAYSGSRIDLEKLAMTCAVLEMPMRILCREGCMGRPDGSAALQAEPTRQTGEDGQRVQRPFAALQQLLDSAKGASGEDAE